MYTKQALYHLNHIPTLYSYDFHQGLEPGLQTISPPSISSAFKAVKNMVAMELIPTLVLPLSQLPFIHGSSKNTLNSLAFFLRVLRVS